MAVTQDKPVPYAAPTSILEIVSRRRHRGLPNPINADVLGRASIPPSLIPRTLQALQTLDLIDEEGNPTPTFEAIRKAPEAEYKRSLEDWLKGAYAEVFAFVDPATDDEVRIRDAFRSYNPAGQQDRMVTLFQGLCVAAGLAPDKPSSPRNTPRPAAQPRPRAVPASTAIRYSAIKAAAKNNPNNKPASAVAARPVGRGKSHRDRPGLATWRSRWGSCS
jgi:hypothetical protein